MWGILLKKQKNNCKKSKFPFFYMIEIKQVGSIVDFQGSFGNLGSGISAWVLKLGSALEKDL